jgi:hypothetical protein
MQYMAAAHRWSIPWKIVFCNMCNDDWNIGHRKWSKKDALLGRANIKKNYSSVRKNCSFPSRWYHLHFSSSSECQVYMWNKIYAKHVIHCQELNPRPPHSDDQSFSTELARAINKFTVFSLFNVSGET